MKINSKFRIILMLMLLLCSYGNLHAQLENRVSIAKKEITLKEALQEIEKQTKLPIAYNESLPSMKKKRSVDLKNKTLSQALPILLEGTNLSYKLENGSIVIIEKPAQQAVGQKARAIQGRVVDETGESLIGVNIQVDGSDTGTVTDFDGNFTIQAASGDKLIFTYIGYSPLTQTIGKGSIVSVVLKENTEVLSEVVVTAMGIEREAKSLTYAAQTIKNDEVTRIKEPNFINALQGKSAGLIITPNNSGAGGGATKIVLRGQTSIMGSNQPLIVIDGAPMNDGMSGQSQSLLASGSRDGGDILSTLNPEDIESMTILKGPNAAALYGSSANNGVINIVTKSGQEGKTQITVNSTTSIETLFMYPETQQIFGLTPNGTLEGWGPKISDMTADEIASKPYLMGEPRDPVKDFFQNGVTTTNGVTISGGNAGARSYFSYNNTSQWGILPNNEFQRHNIMLKENFSLLDKRLEIGASINYIHQELLNRPVTGRAVSPLHAVYRMPANVDMRYFQHNYQHTGTDRDFMVTSPTNGNVKLKGQPIQTWYWYDQHLNNPYWLTNMINDQSVKDRILGNANLRFNVWRSLMLQTRMNVDVNLDDNLNEEYATTQREAQHAGGRYWASNGRSTSFFHDVMLSANERVGEHVTVNAAVGMSYSRDYNRNRHIGLEIDTTGIPNAFDPANSAYKRPGNPNGSAVSASDSYKNTNWSSAVFGTLSVGLFDNIYLDGSYRREWAKSFQQFSTEGKYISFGYYSVGANVMLDKLLGFNSSLINQAKLRGSYSLVGSPIPNQLYARQRIDYHTGAISPRPPIYEGWAPEETGSYEAGLDMWMFNNSLNFDLTYYNSTLRDQYMQVSAGGDTKNVNTGKIRNYGLEFSINYRWLINNDWNWTNGFNIAYNNNKILETYVTKTGAPYIHTVGSSSFQVKYLPGGSYGDLYVNSFERNDDGSIKVNNAGNYATAVPQMASGEFETFVGNATARINLGFNSTLTWKNLSLYFLIDGKIGGKVMSLTDPDRDYYGLSDRTAYDRLHGERVVQNGVEYVLKTLPDGQKVSVENYYRTVGANPMEDYVYDATNLKLRDISLSYRFPNLLGKNRDLDLGFSVKNAFYIYKKSPIDPDISVSAANGFSGIDSYALPTTRSYAFNLKLAF